MNFGRSDPGGHRDLSEPGLAAKVGRRLQDVRPERRVTPVDLTA